MNADQTHSRNPKSSLVSKASGIQAAQTGASKKAAVSQAISLVCSRATGTWHIPEGLLLGQDYLSSGQPELEDVLECPVYDTARSSPPAGVSAGMMLLKDSA